MPTGPRSACPPARPVTSPADVDGVIAAVGIVTAKGGSTSHAAVVVRALGTACMVGAGEPPC